MLTPPRQSNGQTTTCKTLQTYKLNDASNHNIGTEDLRFLDIDSFLMMGSVSTGSQTQVQVIPLKNSKWCSITIH